MDFRLTEEQRAFRETLRAFVENEVRPVAREWEQAGRFPAEIIDGLKELGLFGMTVPEEYGGLALDPVSFAIVFEELARGWMGIAGILGSHSLACRMISEHGTEEQKDRYLPQLATGERRTGLGLTEPGAGTDMQGIATTAIRDGETYVVNGSKMWITSARHADPLPVVVKTDPKATPPHRGMSVLLIEKDTQGFDVLRDLGKLGYHGVETCEVLLSDAQVPTSALLGDVEGRGMQQTLSALEWGRINVAARAVGVGQRALEEASTYAGQREAFGKPIQDFQAVQLKLASMATNVQAARLLTYWAAAALADGRADGQTGMAKIFASEMAMEVAADAMKVHGAYGYSTEYEVERLYRDAPLMAIGEGTNDVLRTVVAKSIATGQTRI